MFAALLSACLLAVPTAGDDVSPQMQQDLQTLGWTLPIDAAELLKRIRFQTLTAQERRDAEANLDRLSSNVFRDREKAMRDLMYANPGVDPLLRARIADSHPEARRRLNQMLRVQRGRWSPEKAEATIRLVRELRPEGAAEALLAFLPYADDRWVALETVCTLRAFGVAKERVTAQSQALPFAIDADGASSPSDSVRQIARRFFANLAAEDHDELRNLCALPFLVGMLPLESDAELDEVFAHGAAGYKADGKMLDVKFGAVTRVESVEPLLPENEANAVRRLASDTLRAVQLRIRVDAQREETGYVLIDFRSDGPRVVGLLDATRPRP